MSDPIKLHQFPSRWGLPNPSPFCVKTEGYLRMAGAEYELRSFNRKVAPNGKGPYIRHGDRCIGDSSNIVRYVQETVADLDASLTPQQRAQSTLIQRTLEEHTYWALLFERWVQDDGWVIMTKLLDGAVPGFLKPLVRRSVKKSVHAHGLSRHGRDEAHARAVRDLDAVIEGLSRHDFLVGDEPSVVDAVGYGFLIQFVESPFENPTNTYARALTPLTDYVARMKSRFWADWTPPA